MRLRASCAGVFVALLLAACGAARAQEVARLLPEPDGSGAQRAGGAFGMEKAVNEFGFWGGGSFSSPTLIGKTGETRFGLLAFRYARVLARGDNLVLKYTVDAVPAAVLSFPVAELVEAPPPFAVVARKEREP